MKKIVLFISLFTIVISQAQVSLVKDINVGASTSMPSYSNNRIAYNGKLLFAAYESSSTKFELWESDGTTAGTKLLKEIFPGNGDAIPNSFFYWAHTNKVYFAASDGNGVNNFELWETNGTPTGTKLLKNIHQSGNAGSYPKYFTELNNRLYFSARSGGIGYELNQTDGTLSGTLTVKDINPGSISSSPESFVKFNNKIYFTAIHTNVGRELYSVSGPSLINVDFIADINPGTTGSNPKYLTVFNNKIYFSANNGTTGDELWETDGTAAGTKLTQDFSTTVNGGRPSNFTVCNNRLFFTAITDTYGEELFSIDTNGNILLHEVRSGSDSSSPSNLKALGNKLFFSADDGTNGRELWVYEFDGTPNNNLTMVKNISPSGDSSPLSFTEFDGKLFFNADDGTNGKELWVTDGTASGTKLVENINPSGSSNPKDLIVVNNTLFFSADNGTNGIELMKYQVPPNPIIASLSPTDNATGIAINTDLIITFDKDIVKGTGSIVIKNASDDSTVETINVTGSNVIVTGKIAKITPSIALKKSNSYYVLIDNGTFKDTSNNPFLGISDKTIWNFETELKTNQTITFNSLTAKTFGDSSFNLTATASSNLPISYSSSNTNVATVTGTVVTIVGAGVTSIKASQNGNSNFNAAADVSQPLTVNKANQTITFGNALPTATYGDSNFNLNSTSSSGLPVTYTSSDTGVASISGNIVTIVGAGTSVITAKQNGNTNYNPANDISETLAVAKANQTITFNPLSDVDVNDPDFNLTATSSSNLAITYASSDTNVATITNNIVSIIGVGTTTITASQTGNNNYNAASNVTQSLTVTTTASVDNFKKFGLVLYPNPISDNFTIKTQLHIKKIEIYNIIGKKVKEYTKQKNNYSIQELPEGIYLIQISTEKGIGTTKILKVKR